MKMSALLCIFLSAQFALASAPAGTSPYSGQIGRPSKALSPEEIDVYLDGKGMGMAKAAELNGYPGPRHVEDLAADLDLTPSQLDATRKLFVEMQTEARELGHALVDEERRLDALFASHAINCDFGYPARKIDSPWLPPRLNFTGTAPPAFSWFRVGTTILQLLPTNGLARSGRPRHP